MQEQLEAVTEGLRAIADQLAEEMAEAGIITHDARLEVSARWDGTEAKSKVIIAYGHNARYELGGVGAAIKLIKEKRKQNDGNDERTAV